MFSGYKQSQSFTWNVLLAVERYLYKSEGRDHALDHLDTWDEGDIYRVVVAFLGARFPMCLALNKSDIPSAEKYCKTLLNSLPIHGAHAGIPMSAKKEMNFVKHHVCSANKSNNIVEVDKQSDLCAPYNVWNCLKAALGLREPVLCFPVSDMVSYAPLPGMSNYVTRDASLPNCGMISCLNAANGEAPTLWDEESGQYLLPHDKKGETSQALRDVLILKPGSTVEDAFLVLKWHGALEGEFVRAECAGMLGDKPKLVKKDEVITISNRILKIMTTKRRGWQKTLNTSLMV
jgi:hypothetical protein